MQKRYIFSKCFIFELEYVIFLLDVNQNCHFVSENSTFLLKVMFSDSEMTFLPKKQVSLSKLLSDGRG
ncbi:hypothetical protein GPEL0_01r3942 [Geoanaerobacter pelophilus]|uniref:Uncharacterized protein n=1 Tax=Geoanaerobacter pelophilus TaxID=60036 RepID=A0ABQ0ML97_9BACT|nr:hypothetical protein GPEL0_01r3942 [Geoanaerobacter pelophilus]